MQVASGRRVPDRILSRKALLEARDDGRILIEPFDQRYVKGCSVDVRLGDFYFEEQPAHEGQILNPWDPDSVREMWGWARQAKPWTRVPFKNIRKDAPVIVMPPKSIMLGHTMEFIGSLDPEITFMVKARSSTGRVRIRICSCAGWGDQGYANRITLELANDTNRSVVLVPGRRIGQIVFLPTTALDESELYYKSGKYQKGSPAGKSYEELCAAWDPEEMLPKQHLDFEVLESAQEP
jgi:dCTP deaminase